MKQIPLPTFSFMHTMNTTDELLVQYELYQLSSHSLGG